jgi:hypothetical protein
MTRPWGQVTPPELIQHKGVEAPVARMRGLDIDPWRELGQDPIRRDTAETEMVLAAARPIQLLRPLRTQLQRHPPVPPSQSNPPLDLQAPRPTFWHPHPYSESQFKTLKYRPQFPDRFGSIQDARAFCQHFFGWYNLAHHHSGIGLLVPADVHYGRAEQVQAARAEILTAAYAAHPERFVRKPPQPLALPTVAWINQPETQEAAQ